MRFFLFLALAAHAHALSIAGYGPVLHDRFVAGPLPNTTPSFIGAGYDFSGVGWNPAYPEQSFAMISDRFFLYAEHYAPSAQISFFSPTLNSVVTANISNTTFRASSTTLGLPGDLAVGMLTAPLSPALGIASYPILKLPAFSAYTALHMLIYGHGAAGVNPRIGTNTFDGVVALDLSGDTIPDDQTIAFSDSGTPTGEAFLIPGDSGSPSFVAWNGELAVVGTHTATYYVNSIPTSFDTFVPDYLDSLTAHGIPYRVVPEPTTAALTLLALGLLGARRRRA